MLTHNVKRLLFALSKNNNQLKMASNRNRGYFNLDGIKKKTNLTYMTGPNLQKEVNVDVEYVDSGLNENTRATVVGFCGSPGSHNDFKYMKEHFDKKNIRLLCLNWPGSAFVPGGLADSYTNEERNSFARELLNKLNAKDCNKLIFMGHSRGGENALQLANQLTDLKWPIIGTALINSPGLKPHKGVRNRMTFINSFAYLIRWNNYFINSLIFPMLNYFYNKIIKLRVANGAVAAAAILPLTSFAFEKQLQTIDDINRKKIKVFYCYGADDFLIEEHISEDYANHFSNSDHYIVNNRYESEQIMMQARNSYTAGKNCVSVNFKEEGHFLQKTYPVFITEMIDSMISKEESKSKF